MPKPIDIQKIKSLKVASDVQVKDVMRRYEIGGACGVEQKGEIFLQQQTLTTKMTNTVLTKDQIRAICEQRSVPWNEEYATRVKHYVASDESVDSYGDIIQQIGWDFSRFELNPTIIWCHDYSQMPIGTAIYWEVKNNELHIDVLFALKDVYPFADMVFRMVDANMCKGNSVGFIPKKIMYVEDADERSQLGLGKYGVLFAESLLLEDTICPIGANRNALVQDAIVNSVRKGIINKDEITQVEKSDNLPSDIRETCGRALTELTNKTTIIVPETLSIEQRMDQFVKDLPAIIKNIVVDTPTVTIAEIKTISENLTKLLSENTVDTRLLTIENDIAFIKQIVMERSEGSDGPESPEQSEPDLAQLYVATEKLKKTIETQLSKKE
jgi:hypothetical protein